MSWSPRPILTAGVVAVATIAVAAPAHAAVASRVTSLSVTGRQALGDGYERVYGVATGTVSGTEAVRGLPAAGLRYTAPYEIIRPTGATRPKLLLVEAENRGSPLLLDGATGDTTAGPPATATYTSATSAFLRSERLAYARVSWETGHAPGVPATAQGVGEVIVRDFGRRLAATYPRRVLGGVSQGAFFVDTFLAEGFNAAPGGGRVYAQALTVDGNGNWLTINQLAGPGPQNAYLGDQAAPLGYARMLKRPKTDPTLVDVANLTDFYRLRAGVTDRAAPPAGVHRYDWPSPHQSFPSASIFGGAMCNGGVPIPLSPLRYAPYLRALVHDIAGGALPTSRRFTLGAQPAASDAFNGLPGTTVPVPRADADGQPIGGVRFPELDAPLGALTPVSIPPVVTTSSAALCGNSGGYAPFSPTDIASRYSRAAYLSRYATALTTLVGGGYLRASDRGAMLAAAGRGYDAAVAAPPAA